MEMWDYTFRYQFNIIPFTLNEINKIKKILGNPEIKLDLINCKTDSMFNNLHISPTPVISITIYF